VRRATAPLVDARQNSATSATSRAMNSAAVTTPRRTASAPETRSHNR
jgi:hypothetical protein